MSTEHIHHPSASASGAAHAPSDAPEGVLQRIQHQWRRIALHGCSVVALCVLVATGLWLLRDDTTLAVQCVYSLGSGLATWLIIDLGRFAIDTRSPIAFPRGWRGVALIVGASLAGHVLGTSLGDAYTGYNTWGAAGSQPRQLAFFLGLSVVTGVGMSALFYAIGKGAHLSSELQTARAQTTHAKLMLLQSQLQPHMLFNTLANLRALIGANPTQAVAMLDRFNSYLRATLAASRSTQHDLGAEFARTDDYLALMAMRMGPRLSYTLDLPADLARCSVPPLLLQPLVENAVLHGLEGQLAGGSVRVRAFADAHTLVLEVTDTGSGWGGGEPQAGFGLTQVRERLDPHTQPRERLDSASPPRVGLSLTHAQGITTATIRLPLVLGTAATPRPSEAAHP